MPFFRRSGTAVFLMIVLVASVASAEVLVARDKQIEFAIPSGFEKQRVSSIDCIEYKLNQKAGSDIVKQITFNYWDKVFYLSEDQFLENLKRARNPKTISSNNIKWDEPIFSTSKYGPDRDMMEIYQKCSHFGKNRNYVWFVIQSKPGTPIHKDNIAVICWASDIADMDATIDFFKNSLTKNLKINN